MSFKGYIYCIKSLNTNNIYIGSTKQSLSIRYSKHKYDSVYENRMKPVHRIILNNGGFSNHQIQLLKEIDVNSLTELHQYEKKIIKDYQNNPNYCLMNYKKS